MPKGHPKNGINSGWFKKGQSVSPSTQFKKGEHRSEATQFGKKEPWNKGKKGVQKVWNKGKTGIYTEEQRKKISTSLRKTSTPIYRSVRDCFKMSSWTQRVFKRDNYTCKQCGLRGNELNAHHIKPFAQIMKSNNITSLEDALFCEELWDLENGITLCKKCHTEIHKKNGGFCRAGGRN